MNTLDGENCINVYSKGLTKLGRFLSNFTKCSIKTEDGDFMSIEGYWYWLSCKDDNLRTLWGYEAKKYGRSVDANDWMDDDTFKRKITQAIEYKIINSSYLGLFISSTLPFVHYYDFKGRIVEPKEGKWVIEFIEELRNRLKNKE